MNDDRRRVPPPGLGASPHDEIHDEVEFHLEERARELVETEGLDPIEARREAERRFGDRAAIERRLTHDARRERASVTARGAGGASFPDRIGHDVVAATRTLLRSPAFTLVAALTLGLALGGTTTIFSVLDSAVLRAIPFSDHDRLVFVDGVHEQEGEAAVRLASVPEFRDWRAATRTLDPLVAYRPTALTLSGEGAAGRVTGELVSAGYFDMLGAEAVSGRTFTAEEFATPGGHPVVVVSHALWRDRFGGDPGLVGRTITLNDRALTVVGVVEPDFRGVSFEADLWIPLGMISVALSENLLESRGSRFLPVVGRLAPEADLAMAQAEFAGIAADLEARFPDAHADRSARIETARAGYLGDTERLLWILFAAGLLLLVIAGANVANLLLVRSHGRAREMVVRRALGAGSGRITGQLLAESVLLAGVGGLLGCLFAMWALPALVASLPDGTLPGYVSAGLDLRVFGFVLAGLASVGVFTGLLPAVTSARSELAGVLRSHAAGSVGNQRHGAQRLFVVTQVALAAVLVVGAGLLSRSFAAHLAVDPGFEAEGRYVFTLSPPRERYPTGDDTRRFAAEVERALRGVAGVEGAVLASDVPFRGGSRGSYIVRPDAPDDLIRYHHHAVQPGYFETLGARFVAGRDLAASDVADGPGVAVVTATMVRRVFPQLADPGDGVGRTVYIGPTDDPENAVEIVGVVDDIRFRDLTESMMADGNSPDVFFAFEQLPPRSMEVVFRLTGDPASVLPALRRAVQEVDPAVPVADPAWLADGIAAQTATPRMATVLMGAFGLLATVLACVGVFGVLSFTVSERSRELAVRRALGAEAGAVARQVVGQGVRLALAGLALGIGAAALGAGQLRALLFEVQVRDPVSYLAAAVLLAGVIVVAATIPALRAARQEPASVLRGE